MIARLKVLLRAAPTYLTAIGVIAAVLADELGKMAPTGWQDNAVQILGGIAAVVGVAISIIRRVMPVAPSQRGMLPQDSGVVGIGVLLRVLALVCLAVFTLIGFGWIVADHGAGWLGAGLALWLISTLAD